MTTPTKLQHYKMATVARHQLGDISRDAPDLCLIEGEDGDDWVGRWVTGFGLVNVRFPKATTRDLTPAEVEHFKQMHVSLGGFDVGPMISEETMSDWVECEMHRNGGTLGGSMSRGKDCGCVRRKKPEAMMPQMPFLHVKKQEQSMPKELRELADYFIGKSDVCWTAEGVAYKCRSAADQLEVQAKELERVREVLRVDWIQMLAAGAGKHNRICRCGGTRDGPIGKYVSGEKAEEHHLEVDGTRCPCEVT